MGRDVEVPLKAGDVVAFAGKPELISNIGNRVLRGRQDCCGVVEFVFRDKLVQAFARVFLKFSAHVGMGISRGLHEIIDGFLVCRIPLDAVDEVDDPRGIVVEGFER